jgi:Ca-activated chloride channel family protein
MPVDAMARLAAKGAGEFATITTDDRDILSILDHIQRNRFETETIASDQTADIWREQGPWLLLFMLPFIALVFRRGVLFLLPLMLIPFSPGADAFGWEELWQNQNQRGSLQFEQGAHERAAELFQNPGWKASSYYRAGDYDEALQYWAEQADESAYYNQGNALAKLGRLDEAVKAYEKALEINPQHQDASYNKKLLEDLIEQQQQQQKDQQDQQQDQQGSEQQQSQDSSQEQQADEEGDRQRSDENNNQQGSQAQQDSDPQTAETSQQQSTQPQASQVDQQENQQTSEDEQLAEMEQQMSEQAADQWLRKIPDDPGGLLRRKFIYQYQNRAGNSVEANQW